MTRRIGFLLVPDFALMSYAAAAEPLRAANVLGGRALYEGLNVSLDGGPIRASNGATILADARVGEAVALDIAFVIQGGNPARFEDPVLSVWLRALARRGVLLGGISGGAYALARAGLLDGHRCTVHWEYAAAFREEFPRVRLERGLYVADRDRLTCGGGVAALDMMHALIAREHGPALAGEVSAWFLHTEARAGSGPQRATAERHGTRHPTLVAALAEIERTVAGPPSRAEIAARAGTSLRYLERLFAAHLGTTIAAHALAVRLDRARALLRQTGRPVLEVALMTGFTSASHFARAYRARHGRPPRAERT